MNNHDMLHSPESFALALWVTNRYKPISEMDFYTRLQNWKRLHFQIQNNRDMVNQAMEQLLALPSYEKQRGGG